jgi:hypothetical protein
MRILAAVAVVLTALILVPVGAHLFELPNKIGLPREQYFTVRSIYRGWALFGIVIFAAIGTNFLVALIRRRLGKPAWFSLAGLKQRFGES